METLIEACEAALLKRNGWIEQLKLAIDHPSASTWHELASAAAQLVASPDHDESRIRFEQEWHYFSRWKCCRCNEQGQERHSCGAYAGKYCNLHWASSGYRDVLGIDYLDAGEYLFPEDAY
ncbi:hypothetical protein ACQ4M3_24260 [Leptolyngbya sp. AN03gr2]|uniref:hypothetical protein n=1 Tax=unclassified Leptolyngbya TaxID=2650499 RepID=UPI003D31959F